jgi:hypothetical protein
MLILAAAYLDILPWVVAWLIIPGAICLIGARTDAHFRPYWDD